MRTINKVILIGNLTRDPELKQTQNGQSVCTFGMATNRSWTTKEGERRESAEFHEVVAWDRRGEVAHQILKKGNLVYVEGHIQTRSWQDEASGKKMYRTEIVLDDLSKLEKRPAGETPKNTTENTPENDFPTKDASAEDAFGAEEPTI